MKINMMLLKLKILYQVFNMVSKDLGTVANNGKYYSPKYWVMKWKDKDDVVIETASKSLLDCQEKVDKLFTENELENDTLYEFISIEIKKVTIFN